MILKSEDVDGHWTRDESLRQFLQLENEESSEFRNSFLKLLKVAQCESNNLNDNNYK